MKNSQHYAMTWGNAINQLSSLSLILQLKCTFSCIAVDNLLIFLIGSNMLNNTLIFKYSLEFEPSEEF